MQDVPARCGTAGALSATHRAGAEAAAEFIARSASAHTRRRQTAAMAVAARDAGEEPPAGSLTRQALEGFRRSAAADATALRGQARGLTAEECAAVLATCGRPRRTGRGLERAETAERRGLVDAAIVALLFHGALRRSEVAVLRWADVELADGGDVVVTVRNQAGDHRHRGLPAEDSRLLRRVETPELNAFLAEAEPGAHRALARGLTGLGFARLWSRPAGPPPSASSSSAQYSDRPNRLDAATCAAVAGGT